MSQITFKNELGGDIKLEVRRLADNTVLLNLVQVEVPGLEGDIKVINNAVLSNIEAGALHRLLNEVLS